MRTKCPLCGSYKVAEVVYGLPIFSEELMARIERKEIVLGGCVITGSSPRYFCYGCEKYFNPPRKREKE